MSNFAVSMIGSTRSMETPAIAWRLRYRSA
jgi:hypothetical protein